MKAASEKHKKSLKRDGLSFICRYECTFCKELTDGFKMVCLNCQAELVARTK